MLKILVVTKGHPFEREPFFQIFDQMEGVDWTLVEQPAAQALFNERVASRYDAYVMYDMPGIRFQPDRAPYFDEPDPVYQTDFLSLVEAGHGFVFMHHAIAGWPAWPEYADLLGGRFLYMPAQLRGRACQDSGYRHAVTHRVSPVGDHEITRDIEPFEITDELYLYEVFEEDVEPLLVSDHAFVQEGFYSATKAVAEQKMFDNTGWTHAPGSNLIGWTRKPGNSHLVYLQCGDDPIAYANRSFQTILKNAITWAAKAAPATP
jgi:type 1 glutamine amidotransferase